MIFGYFKHFMYFLNLFPTNCFNFKNLERNFKIVFRVDLFSRTAEARIFRVDLFSRKVQKIAKSRKLIHAKINPLKVCYIQKTKSKSLFLGEQSDL